MGPGFPETGPKYPDLESPELKFHSLDNVVSILIWKVPSLLIHMASYSVVINAKWLYFLCCIIISIY